MNNKITALGIALFIAINFSMVSVNANQNNYKTNKIEQTQENTFIDNYFIQWQMNFGLDHHYGARYEGPQPIGDCDNDGDNEMLVGGRDGKIRVFEWDESKQTYLEMHTLRCPYYPFVIFNAGGFAIGDLTGDGKNEIGASWSSAIHQWKNGEYKIIGFNNWIFENGGESADCYIGDYNNDGENEFILSGGEGNSPEIVIFKWNGLEVVKEAQWDNPNPSYSFIYMAGLGDIDEDGENEIVCGSAWKVFVLDWNNSKKVFEETVIKTTGEEDYPYACVCKDSDGDGKNEIHVGYWSPKISIFEWNGINYEIKFEKEWPGEGAVIEGVDVGDVDDDGVAEVCVGTDLVHILHWNGSTYVEEAVLPTFGDLAVVSIGDCDNDGKNEIQAGSVMIDHNEDFMSWVFKYDSNLSKEKPSGLGNGRLKVYVKRAFLGIPLKNASVAAWNLETLCWYDIQPDIGIWSTYSRNDLPEGEYLLRVLMEGFKIKETTISIITGEETTHTFSLENRFTRSSQPNIFQKITERIINMFPNTGRLMQSLCYLGRD